MESRTGPGGDPLYVEESERERGSKGPFYVAYRNPDRTRRWGYFCAHCDSFDTAMDSMGRLQCNVCHNVKKPDEWDATHE